jgi:hypothetical protein
MGIYPFNTEVSGQKNPQPNLQMSSAAITLTVDK